MPDATAHDIRVRGQDHRDGPRDGEILPPTPRGRGQTILDHDQELAKLNALAAWMDSAFRVPGTDIRFGLDSLVGIVPGIGDSAALLPSGYIVYMARKLGVSNITVGRMVANIGIDWAIGLIPFLGDVFDVGFKANRRNVALLRQELERKSRVS